MVAGEYSLHEDMRRGRVGSNPGHVGRCAGEADVSFGDRKLVGCRLDRFLDISAGLSRQGGIIQLTSKVVGRATKASFPPPFRSSMRGGAPAILTEGLQVLVDDMSQLTLARRSEI
jgi:hypothetical protein